MNLPYRFHQFHLPTHHPFDKPELRWFTFVGEFLLPIVRDKQILEKEKNFIFWFCNHDGEATPNYQLCFVADDFEKIEKRIEKQMGDKFTHWKKPTDKAPIEFSADERWFAKTTPDKQKRGELVLRLMHSTCELVLDQLVKVGPYWRIERNENGQNPLGNSFESVLHLVSNISEAQFDVFLSLQYQTGWMSPKPVTLRCHL